MKNVLRRSMKLLNKMRARMGIQRLKAKTKRAKMERSNSKVLRHIQVQRKRETARSLTRGNKKSDSKSKAFLGCILNFN